MLELICRVVTGYPVPTVWSGLCAPPCPPPSKFLLPSRMLFPHEAFAETCQPMTVVLSLDCERLQGGILGVRLAFAAKWKLSSL